MMYGRPSKDVSMSEAYPFPPTSPEDLYKPSSPSYISRSPSYVPYKGNWKSPVSGATVKAPSLSFTNPIYSPSFPIYVPRSSPLPGSPPTYSPTSPISKKTPAVTDKPAVKYTAEAQHFMEMMAASEKRALHVEDIPKPKLAASDAAKEDARWSLMKYEDWMPIIDLETGFKYYTDGLYDQEIGVREAETALQTRITDMFSSASTDSYEKFSKARSDAEAGLNRFTEKLRAYTGAAKLLESNLIIRAEIRKKSLVSKAEANIAEAMKLQPGLLETIGWASEEMEVAIRVVESKCAKIEAATSLEEVGDLMVDFVARVDKDSEELSDCDEEVDGTINTENRLWTDDEMEAELTAFYAEEHKQTADTQDNEEMEDVVAPFSTILDTFNDFPLEDGSSHYDQMDQASKDIFDDELLVMAGDESDDEDEELDGPIFGVAAITSPPTADSTILKTDLTFVAEGFSGFAAGAKPFAASSLHIDAATMTKAASNEPALVLAPGVKRSHKVLDDTEAEHSLAKKTKLIQTFIAARIITKKPTSAMRKRKETVRQATVIRTLQRHNKLSACLDSLKESFHAPQVSSSLVVQPFLTMADEAEIVTKVAVKIDFLSTNRAIKAPKSTHAPKTKVFAAGGFSVTAKDTSSELTSLPVDRKRSCFHNGALVKKAKFNHDTIEELQLDAPPVTLPVKALTFDFLPIGRPIKTLKGASADGKAKVFAAGNFSVSTKDISALEPLTVNRKRSFSEDGTLVKKAKLAHDANEEPKLDAAPVTLLVKVLTFDLVSLERPIKALKVTRTAPMSKVFVAGKLSVPNKDTSKVEPLSANRKRACPNDGDAPVKKTKLTHESEAVSSPITPTVKALTFDFVFEAGGLVQNKVKPLSLSQKRSRDDDVEASVKKVKLSAETSELVHSLVAGLKPYLGGSLASRGSTRAYTAKGNGKYAAKTGFWRNALLEKTTMV